MSPEDDRVVAEFRGRQPDDPTTVGPDLGLELDTDETTATCSVCGYFGIVDDDPVIANAGHPETGGELVCDICDEDLEEDSGSVGPIIFGNETARSQLFEEGVVVTFRASRRTTGETWWRKTRTGPKQGDVRIDELEGPVTPTTNVLYDYADRSGFASAGAWQRAINDIHDAPDHGWLYRVVVRE